MTRNQELETCCPTLNCLIPHKFCFNLTPLHPGWLTDSGNKCHHCFWCLFAWNKLNNHQRPEELHFKKKHYLHHHYTSFEWSACLGVNDTLRIKQQQRSLLKCSFCKEVNGHLNHNSDHTQLIQILQSASFAFVVAEPDSPVWCVSAKWIRCYWWRWKFLLWVRLETK